MSLSEGARLGNYVITGQIGAGGMGEVYRAKDTKLDRSVAVKTLPTEFAEDADRVARFEREAKLLASLNHAHIASVHSLDEADGTFFIAMELVEGETLEEKLRRGPLPVHDAVQIGQQIALALEAAHEKGVIHRDLKPANVMITPDGVVKVLDFGLAKAFATDSTDANLLNSPTLSVAATKAGIILGTAPYMSPEQARGQPVDRRADIWAFGAVLYEMVAGKPAFDGATASDILGAVLRLEPNWEDLPRQLPDSLRRVLNRCLQKDLRRRQRDAGDISLDLQAALQEDLGTTSSQAIMSRGSITWGLGVTAAVLLIVVVLLSIRQPPSQLTQSVRRFPLDLPWQTMPNLGDFKARISPQGTHLAYPGSDENRTTIMLRPLDSLDAIPLVSPSADPWNLAFSPDGERLAFFTNGSQLNIVSIRGGQPEVLYELPSDLYAQGLSWGDDGTILIGVSGGLIKVPIVGAESKILPSMEATELYLDPHSLPESTHAFVSISRSVDPPRLAVIDLETAAVAELPFQGSEPIYSPTGHILFRQGTELLAAVFHLESKEVTGQAQEIASGVAYGPRISENGTLVYVAERADGTAGLVWVNSQGDPVPVGGERRDYTHIDLSPDGTKALLNVGDRDIYAYDIERGTFNLTASGIGAASALFPVWDPDGRRATYQLGPSVYRAFADGSAEQELLLEFGAVPTSWSPDGQFLAFFDRQSDIWILPTDGEPEQFLYGPANERSGRFSPDGNAIAYVSDELGGEFQVYVTPFPGPGPRVPVSINGGLSPLWSDDGRELYFRQGSKVMRAGLRYDPELTASTPVEVFDGPYTLDLSGHQRYDVAPDGRFLMVENSEDFRVVVVEGFFDVLNQRVPTN